ncbi:MAG: hypothetical protein Q9181_003183, partial [Wetmoreana brouardii]
MGRLTTAKSTEIEGLLRDRRTEINKHAKAIKTFCRKVSDKNQPAQKLHDAQVSAARRQSLDKLMTVLNINDHSQFIPRDHRVTMGGRLSLVHIECIAVTDESELARILKSAPIPSAVEYTEDALGPRARKLFDDCAAFINQCEAENLPKFGVEACLHYPRTAHSYQAYCQSFKTGVEDSSQLVTTVKELLGKAEELCKQPFENADGLRRAVEEALKLLGKEWYEPVTAGELAAIKDAMISGPRGLATHAGHWYNCANGHPFAI